MSAVRVYIAPFDDDGNYTAFQDVSKDVDKRSISRISRQLEGSEYDVGIFKTANITITLDNQDGSYSDVDVNSSIFAHKRADSKVRITWSRNSEKPYCGFVYPGDFYPENEVTLFEGLLDDSTGASDEKTQKVKFKVLGYEDLFKRVVPVAATFSNGDSVETIMYDALNQAVITNILTVDAANISADLNFNWDDVSEFDNETSREVIEKALEASNSVLYINTDNEVIITARTPTDAVQRTFYGQASNEGIEDITDLSDVRTGLNRTFNYILWEDTALTSQDATSIDDYGVRKKTIVFDGITNNTTRQNILDTIKNEFGSPKQELSITVPLNSAIAELSLLDRVSMDYPTPLFTADGDDLPLLGDMILGSFRFPYEQSSFVLDVDDEFKILGYKYNLRNDLVTFKLRRI